MSPPSTAAARRHTLRALLLVALGGLIVFSLALAGVILGGRLAPLDEPAILVADDVARALPRSAVIGITELGALPTTAAVVTAAALVLVARGRTRAAASLALGFLVVVTTVRLVKVGVERPRPPGHDPGLTTPSFPSAHAAYSTAWLAVALALTRLGGVTRVRTRTRRAAIVVTLTLTLAIAASRPVLDAHYLSDVVGGWGLAASVFGLVGALMLAIGPMRHTRLEDGRRPAPERTGPASTAMPPGRRTR